MKKIIDCENGEVVERQLNKVEKDQQKVDEAALAIEKSEAETKAIARAALLDKLGITADEAKLLLG
jgi:dihydroorotase-like cyclic amidohydrolase